MKRKGAELSRKTKELIVTLLESVKNNSDVQECWTFQEQAFTSLLRTYRRTGSVENLTWSGRKKCFTNKDRNASKNLVKSNRQLATTLFIRAQIERGEVFTHKKQQLIKAGSKNKKNSTNMAHWYQKWTKFRPNLRTCLQNTLEDTTAKLNECKTKTISKKTVQRVLHSKGYK